jgi:hypothetical protein
MPDWAQQCAHPSRFRHLFDLRFSTDDLSPGERLAVVGSGMSAVQAAIGLARVQENPVTLISRRPPEVCEFDSPPCYLGAKCMASFDRTPCPDHRRTLIAEARQPGSVTPPIHAELRAVTREGRLLIRYGSPSASNDRPEGTVLLFEDGEEAGPFDCVLLGTGFQPQRPCGSMLYEAIEREGLEVASCGYPIPQRSLEWAPGLFVAGPLAELELGPTARNIAGARAAAHRLKAAA